MTKKDFQLIARVVASLSNGPVSEVQVEGLSGAERHMVAERFADALAPTNPLFKRDLFIQAATGQVAVTARKAKRNDDPIPTGLDAQGRDSDGNRREYW